jgi:hypothetical protein
VAGPGILIMAPIWAAGAVAYRLAKRAMLGQAVARTIWIAAGVGALAVILINRIPNSAESWFLPAVFSGWDFLLGFLVAANIFSANFLSFGLAKFHAPLAKFAGMTFALYLFHLPLLHLAAATIPKDLPMPVRGLIEAAFTLTAVYLLSFVTEGQKHRWRTAIRWLLRPFGPPESKMRIPAG